MNSWGDQQIVTKGVYTRHGVPVDVVATAVVRLVHTRPCTRSEPHQPFPLRCKFEPKTMRFPCLTCIVIRGRGHHTQLR